MASSVYRALLGMMFSALDVGLDVWTAVSFYQEKAYWCLGLFVFFLLGTSVVVQIFSWLMYSETPPGRLCPDLSRGRLGLLHLLQLGTFFRYVGVVKAFLRSREDRSYKPVAVFLSHDLSMLRVVETFSESAPQLVLMVTIYLQQGHFDLVTVLKALGSVGAVALSVTTYHCSMRSFLPKHKPWSSSAVYFLWNTLLIVSRVAALALFASVLPCFILIHFICSWVVLLFCVWRAKTDFMDSMFGEWLYRGTVGLIWYFNWFEVVCRDTRSKTLLYHGYILTDIVLLCGVWAWKMSTEPPFHEITYPYILIIPLCIVAFYSLGLLVAKMYYKFCHDKLTKEAWMKLSTEITECSAVSEQPAADETAQRRDDDTVIELRAMAGGRTKPSQAAADSKYLNTRMRKMAENFYS